MFSSQKDADKVLKSYIDPGQTGLSVTNKLRRGVIFNDWDKNYVNLRPQSIQVQDTYNRFESENDITRGCISNYKNNSVMTDIYHETRSQID